MPQEADMLMRAPENVEFEFDLAGLGTRFMAVGIDLALQAVVMLAAVFALIIIGPNLEDMSTPVLIVMGVAAFLLKWGYFALFEGLTDGRTPGKRVMKIRVVADTGGRIGFLEAMIRNLIRFVDMAGPGPVCMFISRRWKRLGDFAAGTVVIREGAAHADLLSLPEIGEADRGASGAEDWRLSDEEYELLAGFVARRDKLDEATRLPLARRILEALSDKIATPPESEVYDPESVLEYVWQRVQR